MDIEIEQRGRHLVVRAEHPGERGRDRRCANPAARAHDSRGDMRFGRSGITAAWRGKDGLGLHQRVAQGCGRQRLQQVILDPRGDQITIQPHVIDLADRDNHRARLAHFGQCVDIVQRIAAFRQVDHQDRRARRNGQRLHGVAQSALHHLFGRPAQIDDRRAQRVQRNIVAHEGGKDVAVAGLPRRVHRGMSLCRIGGFGRDRPDTDYCVFWVEVCFSATEPLTSFLR